MEVTNQTFGFIQAIQYLIQGYTVVPTNWIMVDGFSWFTLDKQIGQVFDNRGFAIDIMQFYHIDKWQLYKVD